MQRGSNRQGRSDRGGRGRGASHGSGRGRGSYSSPSYSGNSPRVPTTNQVTSGSHVSIVLKIDQGSDREVQGTVKDVLTSGNHPRGIKVRLEDGRVGRVQRMVTEDVAQAGSSGMTNLGRNGEVYGENGESLGVRTQRRGGYRDIREADSAYAPPTTYGLDDLLPLHHPLRRKEIAKQNDHDPSLSSSTSALSSICPVCNDFTGDEAAVAYHVNSHFD